MNKGGPEDHTRDPVFSWVELNGAAKSATGRPLLFAL